MAKYVNDRLNIFIQEKDMKESVLKTIPVPSNLQEVTRMNKFITQLLEEKGRKSYFIKTLFMRKLKEKTRILGAIV